MLSVGPHFRVNGPIKGSPWVLENSGRPRSRAGINVPFSELAKKGGNLALVSEVVAGTAMG